MPTWLGWIIGICAGVTTIIVAVRHVLSVVHGVIESFEGAVGKVVDEIVSPRLDAVQAELSMNHGLSVKDTVNRIDKSVRELTAWSAEYEGYQRGRNHDMLNQTAALSGLVQWMHRDEMAGHGGEVIRRIEAALAEKRSEDRPFDGDDKRRRT